MQRPNLGQGTSGNRMCSEDDQSLIFQHGETEWEENWLCMPR